MGFELHHDWRGLTQSQRRALWARLNRGQRNALEAVAEMGNRATVRQMAAWAGMSAANFNPCLKKTLELLAEVKHGRVV
jgi:hypothetical protein